MFNRFSRQKYSESEVCCYIYDIYQLAFQIHQIDLQILINSNVNIWKRFTESDRFRVILLRCYTVGIN